MGAATHGQPGGTAPVPCGRPAFATGDDLLPAGPPRLRGGPLFCVPCPLGDRGNLSATNQRWQAVVRLVRLPDTTRPLESRAGASWGLFCARCRARLSEAGGARGEILMLKILFACARTGQFVPTGLRRSLSLTQARVRGEAERRGESAPRFGPRRRRVIFCFCSARWRRWPRRSELRGQLRQAGDRNSTTWGALLVFSHPRARARRSRAARRIRRRALGRGGAELFFVFALLAGGGGRGALSYGVSFAKRAIATARHGRVARFLSPARACEAKPSGAANRRRALGRGGAELFFVFALLAGGGGRGALSYGVSFAKRAIATARHGARCSFSLTRARVHYKIGQDP